MKKQKEKCLMCDKVSHARGYCKNHYERMRIKGNIQYIRKIKNRKCTKDGCNLIHLSSGFCEKHYKEFTVSKNKEKYNRHEQKRKTKRKLLKYQIIMSLGGKCTNCGYDKNIACLDFHHIDPTKKEEQPTKILRNKELALKELQKCKLLCRNCHGEIHRPEYNTIDFFNKYKNEIETQGTL